MAWDDFLYDAGTGRFHQWFLAVLLVVALLAVWAWAQSLYMMFTKDKLIAMKVLDQEGYFPRNRFGRQNVIIGGGNLTGGTVMEFAGQEGYAPGAYPYSNTVRYAQQLGQGYFQEQDTALDLNNDSYKGIGLATDTAPVLNSCSQVLVPADITRAQMEMAYENKHNKNYYVDPNLYTQSTPMEGFSDTGRRPADFAYRMLNEANQGRL